jgi:hypothetical protein
MRQRAPCGPPADIDARKRPKTCLKDAFSGGVIFPGFRLWGRVDALLVKAVAPSLHKKVRYSIEFEILFWHGQAARVLRRQ